jgi:ATP synthase F1 delta subunit
MGGQIMAAILLLNPIIRTYGSALFDFCHNQSDSYQEIDSLKQIFSIDFIAKYLNNPLVPTANKKKYIQTLWLSLAGLGINIHVLIRNFVDVVIENQRIGYMGAILNHVLDLMDEYNQIANIYIEAPQFLTNEKLQEIVAEMTIVKKTIKVKQSVNPALKQGYKIFYNGYRKDNSLEYFTKSLAKHLTK